MKVEKEINVNLHHLWLVLQNLCNENYNLKINKKLHDLTFYVEKQLFQPYLKYDIEDYKFTLTIYYEKPNFSHN